MDGGSGDETSLQGRWKSVRGWQYSPLFIITVLVPFFASLIYYGLVASDVYVSESSFIVRAPQRQNIPGLGALLQGSVLAKANEDANAVHEYVKSRDALAKLDEKLNLRVAFGAANADVFNRFPWLDGDDSFEQLHRYYQKHVVIDANSATTVTTLRVQAYTAKDAYNINRELLELAEYLVNQLNQRARQDMIRYASAEVSLAEEKVKQASQALSEFRGRASVFDPEKQSGIQLQLVAKLQDELIGRKAALAQLRTVSPQNPQIPSVISAITDLESAIENERFKVAGQKSSLSGKSVEYERLALERAFAEKQLASAMTSLEMARDEAQRKQIYLERVALSSLPDAALEPRRIRNIFACLLLGLVAWGVFSMLMAGIREHQD